MLVFRQIETLDGSIFEDLIEIYTDSFPDNQRLPVETIYQRTKQNLQQLFAGFIQDKAIAMSILHPLSCDFILLEYLAIDGEYRGQGIGKQIIQYLLNYCSSFNKYLILEVDNPAFGNEQETKLRRIKFYKSLGAKEIEDVRYIIPPMTGNIPTEGKLMVMGDYPDTIISGTLVKALVKQIYWDLYSRDETDVFLNSFIHEIPDSAKLI